MKVAQFAGYVSAESEYHHGEASLLGVLVAQAQNYVGSNNINLLKPNGLGSRLLAGKDAASPRYIYIELEPLTLERYLEKEDEYILENVYEDGKKKVELVHYLPVIPMVLVNGAIGIGTGFSTSIYQYSPVAIANYIIDKMKGKPLKELIPWYSGFQGKIEKIGANEYSCEGCYKAMKGSKLIITELPIIGKEKATYEYKNFLDTKLIGPKDRDYKKRFIRDYKNYSTDNVVRFEIQFVKVS